MEFLLGVTKNWGGGEGGGGGTFGSPCAEGYLEWIGANIVAPY